MCSLSPPPNQNGGEENTHEKPTVFIFLYKEAEESDKHVDRCADW